MKSFFDVLIYISTCLGAIGAITIFLKKILAKILSSELEPLKGQIHKWMSRNAEDF